MERSAISNFTATARIQTTIVSVKNRHANYYTIGP